MEIQIKEWLSKRDGRTDSEAKAWIEGFDFAIKQAQTLIVEMTSLAGLLEKVKDSETTIEMLHEDLRIARKGLNRAADRKRSYMDRFKSATDAISELDRRVIARLEE